MLTQGQQDYPHTLGLGASPQRLARGVRLRCAGEEGGGLRGWGVRRAEERGRRGGRQPTRVYQLLGQFATSATALGPSQAAPSLRFWSQLGLGF